MITAKDIQTRLVYPAAVIQKVTYAGVSEGDLYLTVEAGVVQVFFRSRVAGTDGRTVAVGFESQEFLSLQVGMTRAQGRQFQGEVARLRLGTFVHVVFAAFEWEGADMEGLFESLDDAREAVRAGVAAGTDRDWWITISEVNKKVIYESGK